jgi:hypothetical protein
MELLHGPDRSKCWAPSDGGVQPPKLFDSRLFWSFCSPRLEAEFQSWATTVDRLQPHEAHGFSWVVHGRALGSHWRFSRPWGTHDKITPQTLPCRVDHLCEPSIALNPERADLAQGARKWLTAC